MKIHIENTTTTENIEHIKNTYLIILSSISLSICLFTILHPNYFTISKKADIQNQLHIGLIFYLNSYIPIFINNRFPCITINEV